VVGSQTQSLLSQYYTFNSEKFQYTLASMNFYLMAPLYGVTYLKNCHVNTTPLTIQTSLVSSPQ